MKKRTLLSWSSGKDSAWALHVLRQRSDCEVVGLFCTVNQAFDRVAMHATRSELLRQQAAAAGLPLQTIEIPYPCDNATYARLMGDFVANACAAGIEQMAFGDLFLADVRRYREQNLADSGIEPLFPLWEIPTAELAASMLAAGVETYLCCVDPRRLPASFAGKRWERALLAQLPADVDPCGENGEFHTVVVDGPFFRQRIDVSIGAVVERDGFVFADVIPAS